MSGLQSVKLLRRLMLSGSQEMTRMRMSDWSRVMRTPLDTNINTMEQFTSPSMNLVPIVIEQTGRGERSYDIYSRLLKVRRGGRRQLKSIIKHDLFRIV